MSKYIKKDENGFYVFDEIEFSKTLPTGLEYFAVDKETEQIYNLGFNYKEKMEKQVTDLEAKLAEKEKEIEELKAQRRIYLNRSIEECNKITDLEFELQHKDEAITQLKQQLAEKEKQLRAKIGNMKTNDFIKMCLQCGLMVDAKEKDNQDKISFALEQLEKVKEYLNNTDINKLTGYFVGNSAQTQAINITNYINYQIKQLKEMK